MLLDYQIQQINKEHRDKNKSTDVLSFPVHENLRKSVEAFGVLTLGDIFICVDIAVEQASEHKIDVESEMYHLFFHGFLHLLGFDHEQSFEEDKIMRDLESELIEKLSKKLEA